MTADVCRLVLQHTIAIPTLTITPTQQVSFGFKDFTLDLGTWNYQPTSHQLVVENLISNTRTFVSGNGSADMPHRMEDHLVVRLMDMPEIDYDAHADILYGLAGQVVTHFQAKFADTEQVRSIMENHAKQMADAVFAQMKNHMWREQTTYRVSVTSSFDQLRPQTFDGTATGYLRDLRSPPERLQDIRRYVFTGFKKGCYAQTKFDSDTERKMALVLEHDPTVRLWMKPGPNQFKIFDVDGSPYQPDFVVETDKEKFIIETKQSSDMKDTEVLRKADAASLWCHIATQVHGKQAEDKPWSYLLVPEDSVIPNATLAGLASRWGRKPDTDLLARFDLSDSTSVPKVQ